MANAWANAKAKASTAQDNAQIDNPPQKDLREHYAQLFERKRSRTQSIRMALVGKENTAKTGTAISIARRP